MYQKCQVSLAKVPGSAARAVRLWLAAALLVAGSPLAALLPARPRWRSTTGWR